MTREESDAMRQRSGEFKSDDPLVSFFYSLLISHLQPGEIEALILDLERHQGKTILFTNGWIAQYAEDLAKRIYDLKNQEDVM